jgi:hypothetical protein
MHIHMTIHSMKASYGRLRVIPQQWLARATRGTSSHGNHVHIGLTTTRFFMFTSSRYWEIGAFGVGVLHDNLERVGVPVIKKI